MTKILIVEDDASILDPLKDYLTGEAFQVTTAMSLKEANDVDLSTVDLVVLDWMLPDGQGIDFLKTIRQNSSLPVIMLTARTELIDKVIGLETGANDYLTKPFEPRELVARIRVQLRQAPQENTPDAKGIDRGEITMDLEARQVHYKGELTALTKMEFELLKLLIESPGKVFSRDEILNKVWGYENFPTTRTVDTHILQLRHKFEDEVFETVRGVGYRYVLES